MASFPFVTICSQLPPNEPAYLNVPWAASRAGGMFIRLLGYLYIATGSPTGLRFGRPIPRGQRARGKRWTQRELGHLGAMPDAKIARQLGRTILAVAHKRRLSSVAVFFSR